MQDTSDRENVLLQDNALEVKDDVRASLSVLESCCDGNELAEQALTLYGCQRR